MNGLSNWTNGNNVPVCADEEPFDVWTDWDAEQRDLFVLSQDGELIFHDNVTTGIPSDLSQLIINNLRIGDDVLNPTGFELYQNYPNPFNSYTEIKYYLPEASRKQLMIYDLTGNLIKTLSDRLTAKGKGSIYWNGRNDNGQNVASGVYLCILSSGDMFQSRKITLLK